MRETIRNLRNISSQPSQIPTQKTSEDGSSSSWIIQATFGNCALRRIKNKKYAKPKARITTLRS
ncbi:hypothetical protein [Archaeoglobus fulgidus]|uniref:hypothetical protein n=1 Tax=Archaeoglobus fulgidus TaxID=2234 RepID=UPI0011D16A4A|nr:hypothetical protein [Archaeoglobus fulgidus]